MDPHAAPPVAESRALGDDELAVARRFDPYRPNCPSRALLDRIGDKWTMLILGALSHGEVKRFGELRRHIEGVSQKMLTQTLRELERDGLVTRTAYPVTPPRVEYGLTALGESLRGPLTAVAEWSNLHTMDVLIARERYDQLEP